MKFVRNLSMLVLLACVSVTLGCTESADTGGAGDGEAGSGAAAGTLTPAHDAAPPAAPAGDAPAAPANP